MQLKLSSGKPRPPVSPEVKWPQSKPCIPCLFPLPLSPHLLLHGHLQPHWPCCFWTHQTHILFSTWQGLFPLLGRGNSPLLPDICLSPSSPSFCSNVVFSLKPTLTTHFKFVTTFPELQPSRSPLPTLHSFHNACHYPKCYIIYILLHLFIVCPLSLSLCQNRALYCIHTDAKMEKRQLSNCVRENPDLPYNGFLPWESPSLRTQSSSLLTLLVTKCVEIFPTPTRSWTTAGVQEFSSVLALSNWRWYQSYKLRAQSQKTIPTSQTHTLQMPVRKLRLSPVLLTNWL